MKVAYIIIIICVSVVLTSKTVHQIHSIVDSRYSIVQNCFDLLEKSKNKMALVRPAFGVCLFVVRRQ